MAIYITQGRYTSDAVKGLVDRFLESAHMRGIPSKQHGVYILVQ